MKGYVMQCGYVGFVPFFDKWMLFATESEYLEYVKGLKNEE